jgi:hypothetical protein
VPTDWDTAADAVMNWWSRLNREKRTCVGVAPSSTRCCWKKRRTLFGP